MSKYRYTIPTYATELVFDDNVRARCTLCGKRKPIGAFGMRTMGDGTLRVQAQCSPCRNGGAS